LDSEENGNGLVFPIPIHVPINVAIVTVCPASVKMYYAFLPTAIDGPSVGRIGVSRLVFAD